MSIFLIILIIVLVITTVLLIMSFVFTGFIIYPKRESYDMVKNDLKTRLNYSDENFKELIKSEYTEIFIDSSYGYQIYSRFFLTGDKKKFVVLLHRETRNLMASYKFLEMYKNLGYSVVMFDARYHGKSGGNNYTYGYFERWDLKSVTDYIRKSYGDVIIGFHGEAGGAATALLNLSLDKKINFAISDSSFTNLLTIIKISQKKFFHTGSEKLLMIINQIIKRRAGFSIIDVSPLFEIEALTVPVLFIHSEKDSIIPLKMSMILQSFKSGYNDMFIGKESQHLLSYYDHREEYEEKIKSFLYYIESNIIHQIRQ